MSEEQEWENETSRQYWRDPFRFARNKSELQFGTPAYYVTPEGTAGISENLVRILDKCEADKDWRVLEIGCNCGRNMLHLANAGYKNVHGVEINPRAVEYAWNIHPHIAKNMTVSDAQSFLAMREPSRFDLIFTQSVLMHVPPEDDYLFSQMARVASRMIMTCEVELGQKGNLLRHKFNRKYDGIFTAFGWKEIYKGTERRRTIRVFTP